MVLKSLPCRSTDFASKNDVVRWSAAALRSKVAPPPEPKEGPAFKPYEIHAAKFRPTASLPLFTKHRGTSQNMAKMIALAPTEYQIRLAVLSWPEHPASHLSTRPHAHERATYPAR